MEGGEKRTEVLMHPRDGLPGGPAFLVAFSVPRVLSVQGSASVG